MLLQLRARRDAHQGRVRRGRPRRRPHVRRRGAGLPRGPAGPAVRRPGRQAPRAAARVHRHDARAGLHRQRPQEPPAQQPRPAAEEIDACRPYLWRQIEIIRPKVICTLGNFATKLLTGDQTGITKVHGRPRATRDRRAPAVPVPDLPSGRGAVHAGQPGDAQRGLPAAAGAAGARRAAARRRGGRAAGRGAAGLAAARAPAGAGGRAGGRPPAPTLVDAAAVAPTLDDVAVRRADAGGRARGARDAGPGSIRSGPRPEAMASTAAPGSEDADAAPAARSAETDPAPRPAPRRWPARSRGRPARRTGAARPLLDDLAHPRLAGPDAEARARAGRAVCVRRRWSPSRATSAPARRRSCARCCAPAACAAPSPARRSPWRRATTAATASRCTTSTCTGSAAAPTRSCSPGTTTWGRTRSRSSSGRRPAATRCRRPTCASSWSTVRAPAATRGCRRSRRSRRRSPPRAAEAGVQVAARAAS